MVEELAHWNNGILVPDLWHSSTPLRLFLVHEPSAWVVSTAIYKVEAPPRALGFAQDQRLDISRPEDEAMEEGEAFVEQYCIKRGVTTKGANFSLSKVYMS